MRRTRIDPTAAWSWRRFVFWCIFALLLTIALVLGYGRWVFDVLHAFRSTSSNEQLTASDLINAPMNVTPSGAMSSCKAHEFHDKPRQLTPPVLRQPRTKVVLAKSNEEEARAALERLTKRQFPSIRPPWLTNPRSGRRLECDCYNPELKLCVEVSGKQHFSWPNHFHATVAQFQDQLYRDELKRSLLRDHGDVLIVVPFWIKRKFIQDYLFRELQSHGFQLPATLPSSVD